MYCTQYLLCFCELIAVWYHALIDIVQWPYNNNEQSDSLAVLSLPCTINLFYKGPGGVSHPCEI